jgi:SAM-dependent methyltransferase
MGGVVHEVAAEGFSDPGDYEAARPSYPPDAVAWFVEHLHIAPGAVVVDLAAGTGKLTRLLAPSGADIVAVEPLDGMRASFRALLPAVPLVAGTAEALPIASGALDAMTVAQAWHWFDHDRAIAEVVRVLRPGGRVGLVWNARDRTEPWVDAVWTIMDRVEKRAPWRDHENWRDSALNGPMPGFGELHAAEFRHIQTTTPEGVVQRVASVSHVAVLPPAEQQEVLDEVRQVVATHPAVRGRETVEIPYRVDCYWAERH